jgi:hypothetical protein
MNLDQIVQCLERGNHTELGIPLVLPSLADKLQDLSKWALTGSPVEGRQLWFGVANAVELRTSLPAELRNRIQPLLPTQVLAAMKRGPYDALLLPHHGFSYSDPNCYLTPFWKQRGAYEQDTHFTSSEFALWVWKSKRRPLKLFGIDHHHAVQWDAKQILRMLGAQLDFVWLCDGRPPVNEALPCQIPSFQSSLDLYRPPANTPFPDDARQFFTTKPYDAILTSHSLVTCHRFKDLGLPMLHINSTRFGNDWIQDPKKHQALVDSIQNLLQTNRLTIIHNNQGDKVYFHQYFPYIQPDQEVVIPSLCESVLRLRTGVPPVKKLLLWDTRQVLLQEKGSPFMKELYAKLRKAFGDAVESQAIRMAEAQSYLPEGYLDEYTAVIHIPYNVSTMSMFQQVRANIPIWIPSKRLLAKLWSTSEEPNELSWCMFAPGTEANASALDNARDERIVKHWLDRSDFYDPEVLPLALPFDSIEELVEKVMTTDYQTLINQAEETQEQRRENIVFAWEQVLDRIQEHLKQTA